MKIPTDYSRYFVIIRPINPICEWPGYAPEEEAPDVFRLEHKGAVYVYKDIWSEIIGIYSKL